MAVQIADTAYLGGGHLDACLRLLLAETLHALPPALIFTAEFDPLRDESKQYAARVERVGIAVRCMRYQGALDGYSNFAGLLTSSRICA